MSVAVNQMSKLDWSCSICFELMNGEKNGKVCMSKHCMHIFHAVCIERVIDEKQICPLCRAQIDRSLLVNNPEHEEQCRKWEENPSGYTLEKAFLMKYGKTPKEKRQVAEDVLRPESLHGNKWVPEISLEAQSGDYHERIQQSERTGTWIKPLLASVLLSLGASITGYIGYHVLFHDPKRG